MDSQERETFNGLLAASIQRVQNDLLNPNCANDYRNAAKTSAKAATVSMSNQGLAQVTEANGVQTVNKRSPGDARYNPITGSINAEQYGQLVGPKPYVGRDQWGTAYTWRADKHK